MELGTLNGVLSTVVLAMKRVVPLIQLVVFSFQFLLERLGVTTVAGTDSLLAVGRENGAIRLYNNPVTSAVVSYDLSSVISKTFRLGIRNFQVMGIQSHHSAS